MLAMKMEKSLGRLYVQNAKGMVMSDHGITLAKKIAVIALVEELDSGKNALIVTVKNGKIAISIERTIGELAIIG